MEIVYRNDRSAASFLLRVLFIKPFASQLTKISKHYEAGSPRLSPPLLVRKSCNVGERRIEDVWIYDISAKDVRQTTANQERKPKRVYYFAGGSWQSPPDSAHWKFLAGLACRMDQPVTVSLISCPLAPKSPASATFPILARLYNVLSSEEAFRDEDVSFAGDSSGGNIALALTMYSLNCKDPPCRLAPASLVLVSPTVDLSHENPGLEQASKLDPLESLKMVRETADVWAQGMDKHDPRLSPGLGVVKVLADWKVRVYGIIAGDDVLSVEAKVFIKQCEADGVQGRFLCWEHQMHNFPVTAPYKIPEGVKAIEWVTLALNEGGHRFTKTTRDKFEHIERAGLRSFTRHLIPVKFERPH